jgi:hypothetical protein
MKRTLLLPAALSVVAISSVAPFGHAQKQVPLPLDPVTPVFRGGGFEESGTWTLGPGDNGMSVLSAERASSGVRSLKVTDNSETSGSDATGPRIPIEGAGFWTLSGKVYGISGNGLGIYVRVLDKDGKTLGAPDDFQTGAPTAPINQWNSFTLNVYTPEEAAFLEVWVHSYGAAKVTAYLDDFVLTNKGSQGLVPPWKGTYKIKPGEKAKMTAADILGPDGIVYPDWRYAGVPGGIPRSATAATVPAETFGAQPNDGKDDSTALEQAAEAVGKKGGVLLLAPGVYHLDRPITITRDNVILRGAGAGKTRIVFRYSGPKEGVGFFAPAANASLNAGTWVEIHAAPKDLRYLSIEADGKMVAQTAYYPQHWGGTFSLRTSGAKVLEQVKGNGEHTLTAVATYADGRTVTKRQRFVVPGKQDAAPLAPARLPAQIGAIMFSGVSTTGPEVKLLRDGERGDTTLTLQSTKGIKAGDKIRLRGPATERWNKLVRNAAKWGEYRRYEFTVTKVSARNNTITLNQPLRISFPREDGSFISTITPIRRCGVEDLTLEQTEEIWTSGIVFSNAWECWAKGVTVKKAGRFPLYFLQAKWCEIRDCVMDDAWYKGGGGTAYVGWEYAADCLMDTVKTINLRHAPCVQWSASGNVIRNGTFINSDGQWHSGWTNENLFENCVIVSQNGTENGGYSYGLWASPPEDDAHGPNGPRNVVYHCDVQSDKAGIWMGGMNENWLIVYNRFRVKSGPGIFAKTASFDHIIQGNSFSLATNQPMVQLGTPDCIGLEVSQNLVMGGNGKAVSGPVKPALSNDNRFVPVSEAAESLPRPAPLVPSIFEWQRKNKPLAKAVSQRY